MKFQTHYIPETDSTNSEIKRLLAQKDLEHGFCLRTGYQSAGRGAYKNVWESSKDQNLLCSFFLKPEFLKPQNQFLLSKAISLAVVDTLKHYISKKKIRLKWPNDIYVGDKKIAGILIETGIRGNALAYAIVGVGLNVNQQKFVSDAPNPTSMALETDIFFKIETIQDEMKLFVKERFEQLKSNSQQLKNSYHSMLYRLNVESEFYQEGRVFKGIVTGVDEIGRLKIYNSATQITELFSFKEIRFSL